MKILYAAMHCSKYDNRRDIILQTWGKHQPLLFFSDTEDLAKYTIKASDKTDYSSNEDKFVNGVKWLKGSYLEYDWYFFIDNDTFVNTNLTEKFLLTADTNTVYGELITTWPQDPTLAYLSGGAGFLVHRDLVLHAQQHLRNYNTTFSDVTYGLYAKEFGIKLSHDDKFKSQPPQFYNISRLDEDKYICFHHITREKMIDLNRIIK